MNAGHVNVQIFQKKKVSCRRREFHGGRHETSLVFSSYRDADSLRHRLGVSDDVSVPKFEFAWAPSLATADSDENGRKRTEKPHFYFRFYIFLAETGSGSENTGTETGSGYAEVRKRTNTDVEPERIMQSNILEYTLTKSQNNIHVRSY